MSPKDEEKKEKQEEPKQEAKDKSRPGTASRTCDPTVFYGQSELNTEGFNTGYYTDVPFCE
jgi:hypothetical protein